MARTEHIRALEPDRTLTVVSGMPRSGTSMMMQMLEAAGLDLATDGRRGPDLDNPHGYFELDAVKRLREDASFVGSVVGRVVKIVTPLLPFLPSEFDYRVILMERDLVEILASQRSMLDRRVGRDAGHSDEKALARAFRRQIDKARLWLNGRANIRACAVSYRTALSSPSEVSAEVAAFLENTAAFGSRVHRSEYVALAAVRMASAIDPQLHRQRSGSGGS